VGLGTGSDSDLAGSPPVCVVTAVPRHAVGEGGMTRIGSCLCLAGMVAHGKTSFVDEYAGNVAFYTYLAQRFRAFPVILKRNLSYRRGEYTAERKRLNGDNLSVKSVHDRCTAAKMPNNTVVSGESAHSGSSMPSKSASASADNQAGDEGDTHLQKRGSQGRKAAVIFRLRHQQGSQEW
jgi:hypothetical protein